MDTIDGHEKRFETHPSVRTDHCNIWTGNFSNTCGAAHFIDHILDDRIVNSSLDVGHNEYFIACRLKLFCRSDSGKVDIMVSLV
jgi:hypothetical protein